jgi:hypothetical protein
VLIQFRFHSQSENLLRASVAVLHAVTPFDLIRAVPFIYLLSLSEHPVRRRAGVLDVLMREQGLERSSELSKAAYNQ